MLVRSVDVVPIEDYAAGDSVLVESPIRVHLSNGHTYLFPDGALFSPEEVQGAGQGFDLNLYEIKNDSFVVLSLEDVAAVEYLSQTTDAFASIAVSLISTSLAAIGTAGLLIAIFGSCPTVYVAEADTFSSTTEAELFANSIVPLFEMRDIDRLSATPDTAGIVRLQLRNEALETHYINHLELLEVQHDRDEVPVSHELGKMLILGDVSPIPYAVDRSSRDLSAWLTDADSLFYSASPELMNSSADQDMFDYIDLAAGSSDSDSVALYLRLRNSLLTTVFMYDYMLDAQGANSIDWMANTLNSIGGAVKLGHFYEDYMGLEVQQWNGTDYQTVHRIEHVGPIAWDHVAIPFEPSPDDSVKLRLRFLKDAWRIDQAALATEIRWEDYNILPLKNVTGVQQEQATTIRQQLELPDESYFTTFPGQQFELTFQTLDTTGHSTYFIAAQGYYIEWIRGSWIRDNVAGIPFSPSDTLLKDAFRTWNGVKDQFERDFFQSKIPVR